MEKLILQDLPKINGDGVIISSQQFNLIRNYINAQTEIINNLTETVNSLIKKANVQDVKLVELRSNINSIANIIKTLGGTNND